jgi:tetratricopeptide (TPR) repeat protein
MERTVARERAAGACQNRRVLVTVEGGEEADGAGRGGIHELLSVLSPQNRWLLLTRLHTQAAAAETVTLQETLDREDAGRLLDRLTKERVSGGLRERLLDLLEGHPLALTWAGNLIARDDETPERLIEEWEAENLASLSDPTRATHTLEWLFRRSAQGLDETARQILEAAGLLAAAPFPLAAIDAALPERSEKERRRALRSLVQSSLLRLVKEANHWQFTHVLGYRVARRETGSDRDVRLRLGQWLHAHFQATLAVDALREAPLSLTRALEHLAALLRADDDQTLWTPLVNSTLYEFRDRLTDLGRLALVKIALSAVEGWLERFPQEKALEPYWVRERSVLLTFQGDVLQEQGDLRGALEAFRKYLQVSERLAGSDPLDAERQRDLSIAHNKVGHVLREQGDLPGALEAFQKSLQVRQRLAGSDPSHAGWQRDLSVSHNKVGEVLRVQGDLRGAIEAFRESLKVSERLADSDPSHAGWQRDVSFNQTCIAQILDRQGDHAEALRHALASLAIDERLAALDATNVTWQRDVAISRALVKRLRG